MDLRSASECETKINRYIILIQFVMLFITHLHIHYNVRDVLIESLF